MPLTSSSTTMSDRAEDLGRRYRAAADDAARLAKGLAVDDHKGRMRAVVDAVWTHLHQAGVSWVGFYLPEKSDQGEVLVLGPSRNTPACSPIGLHGVCGQCYTKKAIRLVQDVRELGPNYIACDPRDRSEVVLPLVGPDGRCIGVLDVDSHEIGRFSEADATGLASVLRSAGLTA